MKNNLLRTGLSVMSMTFQSWLNFQETQYAKEGETVNDDIHFRTPATYPTRGVLKAWIATLDKAQFTLQMHTVVANDLLNYQHLTTKIIEDYEFDAINFRACIAKMAVEIRKEKQKHE